MSKKYLEAPGRDICYCQSEELMAHGITCERCHRHDEIDAAHLAGAAEMVERITRMKCDHCGGVNPDVEQVPVYRIMRSNFVAKAWYHKSERENDAGWAVCTSGSIRNLSPNPNYKQLEHAPRTTQGG